MNLHFKSSISHVLEGAQSYLFGRKRPEPLQVRDTNSTAYPVAISTAFQPIFKVSERRVFAYEALARTVQGEGFSNLMRHVTENNRFSFDQKCRAAAMACADRLGLGSTGASLCLNVNPNSAMDPEACIDRTLQLADRLHFPVKKIILEVTEDERAKDPERLNEIVQAYRKLGMRVAIDDFGAGYAGLSMLAQFAVDFVKIDIQLVRNIHRRDTNRAIVEMIIGMASRLGVAVVAEGVEKRAEYETLRSLGVDLMQGYLLAKPGFEFLPVSYGWASFEHGRVPMAA